MTIHFLQKKKILVNITDINSPLQKEIILENFSIQNIGLILKEVYRLPPDQCAILSKICSEKTKGNPFHFFSFLKEVEKKKLIYPSKTVDSWNANIPAIAELPSTDNVLDFLSNSLTKLEQEMQKSIAMAAAIGNKVESSVFEEITKFDEVFKKDHLIKAVNKGFLSFTQTVDQDGVQIEYFLFPHDEIRRAFYNSYSEAPRIDAHLKIAQVFEARFIKMRDEADLFRLLKHYYLANEGISSEVTFTNIINYAIQAGHAAKAVLAYRSALVHFKKAYDVLKRRHRSFFESESHWDLFKNLVETAFLCGEYELINKLIEQIETENIPFLEMLPIYEYQIHCFLSHEKFESATIQCVSLLKRHYQLKIPFSKTSSDHISILKSAWKYVQIRIATHNFSIEKLKNLKNTDDKWDLGLMSLLTLTAMSIYNIDTNGFMFTICESIQQVINRGNNKYTPPFYAALGLVLCQMPRPNLRKGTALAKLTDMYLKKSIEVANPFHSAHVVHGLVKFWDTPLCDNIDDLRYWLDRSIKSKSINASSHLLYSYLIHSYYAGENLFRLKDLIERYRSEKVYESATLTGIRNPYVDLLEQVISNITSQGEKDITVIDGRYFNQKEDLLKYGEDQTLRASFNFFKLQLNCFLGNYQDALRAAKRLRKTEGLVGMLLPQQCFYDAFAQLNTILSQERTMSTKERKTIQAIHAKLCRYSKNCPENFKHQFLMIKGLRNELQGQVEKAQELYLEAIEFSRKNHFLHEAALFWQIFADSKERCGKVEFASFARERANQLFYQWGARFGERKWLSNMKSLYTQDPEQRKTAEMTLKLIKGIKESDHLDEVLLNIIKCINSIVHSSRMAFLIHTNQNWQVIFDSQLSLGSFINEETFLSKYPNLPADIIQHSIEIESPLRLKNAIQIGDFTFSSYVKAKQVKSILCLPLISINRIEGLLYLEKVEEENYFAESQVSILQAVGVVLVNVLRNSFSLEKIEKEIQFKTERIAIQKEQIETLHRELTHRYGNTLGRIRAYLSASVDDRNDYPALKEAILRIDAAVVLHDHLILKDGIKVQMYAYLPEIVLAVFRIHGIPSDGVIDIDDIDDLEFNTDIALKVGFIVCELSINACKYAFPNHLNPKFQVILRQQENENSFILIVRDNGSGYSSENVLKYKDRLELKDKRSEGLGIVKNLCREFGKKAKPIFKNNQGAYFELNFYI